MPYSGALQKIILHRQGSAGGEAKTVGRGGGRKNGIEQSLGVLIHTQQATHLLSFFGLFGGTIGTDSLTISGIDAVIRQRLLVD